MKVLDNSFSRITHISGEILKFTLCTGIYSMVNKKCWFFLNFIIFYLKKNVLPADGSDMQRLNSLLVQVWV